MAGALVGAPDRVDVLLPAGLRRPGHVRDGARGRRRWALATTLPFTPAAWAPSRRCSCSRSPTGPRGAPSSPSASGCRSRPLAVNVAIGFAAIALTLGTVRWREHVQRDQELRARAGRADRGRSRAVRYGSPAGALAQSSSVNGLREEGVRDLVPGRAIELPVKSATGRSGRVVRALARPRSRCPRPGARRGARTPTGSPSSASSTSAALRASKTR